MPNRRRLTYGRGVRVDEYRRVRRALSRCSASCTASRARRPARARCRPSSIRARSGDGRLRARRHAVEVDHLAVLRRGQVAERRVRTGASRGRRRRRGWRRSAALRRQAARSTAAVRADRRSRRGSPARSDPRRRRARAPRPVIAPASGERGASGGIEREHDEDGADQLVADTRRRSVSAPRVYASPAHQTTSASLHASAFGARP